MKRILSGYTSRTQEHLLLNAGVWFKNFEVGKDTFDSAVAEGKLLGATQGGGTFTAKPSIEVTQIDGLLSDAKGAQDVSKWDISMQANVIEVTPEVLRDALGAAFIDSESDEDYDIIKGTNYIDDSYYLDNVTWLGTLSKSDEPVIIQIFNAISVDGLTVKSADNSKVVVSVTFKATQEVNENTMTSGDYAPFVIYYPKSIAAPKPDELVAGDTEITGTGVTGAVVTAYGGTIPAGTENKVDVEGRFSLTIPAQTAGEYIYLKQTIKGKNGKTSLPVRIEVMEKETEEE